MQINVTFDQTTSSLPAGFVSAIDYVVNYYETLFSNNVTINLDVGYGEIDGQALAAGALGESEAATYVPENYNAVRNALISENAPGASTLPVSAPLSGQLYLSQAEAQALGLTSAVSTNYVGFSSVYPFSYATNVTPSSSEYYFIGIAEHEISEDMGRVSLLNYQPDYYSPIDLFRYSSAGVRDTVTGSSGSTAYFSINDGTTNLGNWNNNPNNGDLADWYPSGPAPDGNDAFNDYSGPGVINAISADDITLMQALGWTTASVSVSAQSFIVGQGQSAPISQYFSVANPNGDDITEYEFEDLGGGSGHLNVNGTTEPDNQIVVVSTANLSSIQYVGGTTPGADMLRVGAFDATTNSVDWGAPFTATTEAIIQTDTSVYGSTSLAQVGINYALFAAGTTSGPELQLSSSAVTVGEFASWAPIGAVQTATGYDVAWQDTATGQYTVWATDNNGNYLSNIIGVVAGDTYALESMESTFGQDLNGDGTIGFKATVLQTDGATSIAQVGDSYALFVAGTTSGPELQLSSSAVSLGEFPGWAPIGAVRTVTGYDVAWEDAATGEYTVWATDSNGNYLFNIIGVVAGDTYALESMESTFSQDLNGDGTIGLKATVFQTDGATSIAQVGDNYALFAVGTNSGPELQLSNSAVTVGEFPGWAPIGAVQTATGYDVAWEDAATGQYTVWATDSNGNYLSNIIGVVAGNSYALESMESTFGQDLNGDGTTGLTKTVIRTDGSTSLTQVANEYFLDNSSESGPALQLNGANVTTGEFAGWAPIGAVQTATGYDVAWEDTATGQYTVWATDSNGNYLSNIIGVVAGNSYALESMESTFGQDLNGDGTTGLTKTVIQTDGSTSLTQVANEYFLDNGSGSGPVLQLNGANVTAGEFAGWAPIGAVQTATDYDVAWEDTATGQYTVWSTNSSGQYTSNLIGVVAGTSTALEEFEPTFGQDLNGDGVVGLYAAPSTTLQISSALAGAAGAATIGAGATLDLAAADSAAVTFATSTGELVLANPSSFTGKISGFAGNGTLAGSDQIDLKGLSDSGLTDSYSNGVLTLTSGSDTVQLDFNGSYALANFSFASDGSGGTIAYDPPAGESNDLTSPGTGSCFPTNGDRDPRSIDCGPQYENTAALLLPSVVDQPRISPAVAGVLEGFQKPSIALLSSYIASSFVTVGNGIYPDMAANAAAQAVVQWHLAVSHHS